MSTDLVVAAPIPAAQIGADADAPAHAQAKAAELTAMLERADAGPVGTRYEGRTLFFYFNTPFRRNRALELLPPSYPAGNDTIFVQTALVPEASAGAVAPLVDCVARGEALLRAADIVSRVDCGPYGVCCPVCGGPQTGRCKCFMADSWCANGHHWHFSKADVEPYPGKPLAERSIHAGPANHGRGPCCDNPRVLYAPTSTGTPAAVGQVIGTAQETPWTCGPAALRAVLAHYGRDVTEPEVSRAASNVPAIGARPEGMVRAAEVYGCHAKAFMMNGVGELVELLARRIPPIVIVDSWTRPGKVGHYVVVSRVDLTRGLVTVMDPHTEGNWRVMTVKEFDERWWAKRRGKDGELVIVRRVCVVVTPGDGMVVVGADKSPVVAPAVVLPDIRGDIPSALVQRAIAQQVERLIRNDMGPLWVEHKIESVSAGTITFVFATGFRAGRAGELLPASLRIEGRALKLRTRVFDPDVELGGDAIWPALRGVIDKHKAKLAQSNVAPDEIEFFGRTVTFVYRDVNREAIVAAADLLPAKESVDGKTIYFKTRTIGRDLDMGAVVGTGGDEAPSPAPTHGRTAKIKGASKGMKTFAKVAQAVAKAVVTFFTGGAGAKAYDALLDVTGTNVAKMKPNEQAAWFNSASNPEMYAWALSRTRDSIREIDNDVAAPKSKHHEQAVDYKAILNELGLTRTSIDNIRTAMVPALKFHLWFYALRQGKNKWGWIGVPRNDAEWNAHALQAILILFYDGLAATWPIITSAVKHRPTLDWDDSKSAGAVAGWVDAVVAALESHRTVPEGADNPNLTIDDVLPQAAAVVSAPGLAIAAPISATTPAQESQPAMVVATEVAP